MRLSWHGAIAQLGERYSGTVEVVGSIPSGSTSQFLFRELKEEIMALFGRILLIVGLVISSVSLVLGFGFMFNDYDELAKFFLMAIPFGFVMLFTGVSTVVMFSPREIENVGKNIDRNIDKSVENSSKSRNDLFDEFKEK